MRISHYLKQQFCKFVEKEFPNCAIHIDLEGKVRSFSINIGNIDGVEIGFLYWPNHTQFIFTGPRELVSVFEQRLVNSPYGDLFGYFTRDDGMTKLCLYNKVPQTFEDLKESFLFLKKALQSIIPPAALKKEFLQTLICKPSLQLPVYQREYEWGEDHVNTLLDDIYQRFSSGKEYLMGTIILHRDDSCHYNIVDGQQRLITLSLLLNNLEIAEELPLLQSTNFANGSISHKSLYDNNQKIAEFVGGLSGNEEKFIGYLRNKLSFRVLTLSGPMALDLAYTFFDSINSMGKTLSDVDLLKAHHLMFLCAPEDEKLAKSHNEFWIGIQEEEHQNLLEHHLSRIRRWGRGIGYDSYLPRTHFKEYSSVNPDPISVASEHRFNRYMQPNKYHSWSREGLQMTLKEKKDNDDVNSLPMQVTQSIEGGDMFFRYVRHYHKQWSYFFPSDDKKSSDEVIDFVRELCSCLRNLYLENAFKAIMLFYVDKFGDEKLQDAACCVQMILSDMRYQHTRLLNKRVCSSVCEKCMIPIIRDASSAEHAIIQLFAMIKTYIVMKEEKNVQKDHKDNLSGFYKRKASFLLELQPYLLRRIKSLYLPNQNDN